jgi:hypothetical protein
MDILIFTSNVLVQKRCQKNGVRNASRSFGRGPHTEAPAPLLNHNKPWNVSPLAQKMVFRELTSAQRSAIRVAATGNLDRLKELLNGRDVIKDSDKLITAIHEHRLVADDHDRISLDYLLMAAARGHVEMLRYLLGRYPYPGNAIPPEAVVNAVNSASTETLQVLLDLNPPVTLNVHITHTGKPLDHALSLDRRQDALKMTEFLLQHGTGPNIDCSPMESAILSSWPELVRLLERYV